MKENEEEMVLIQREYNRHKEAIYKFKMRERNFEMKNMGYNLSIDIFGEDIELLQTFFGYADALGISTCKIHEHIATAIISANVPVVQNIYRIMLERIRDEAIILSEIVKCTDNIDLYTNKQNI
ncbi:hypothetical protein CWI42_100200 [Ordospora colligata]|uniref:Uncharacterized protein n=1 Tax=Ordospora colligata OC4 TaxID=1354746 RepID=A0A0B2UD86_9MICR|nr:uncharacterized protein M896_100200 [Ordospora colligata OC4]KHN69036.1 hypothetical protein M896_100200 [Ordospora colligata OC4]TBU14317.1 hypothetical protein CWI40_100210 [Ordospora colligata]TBU14382.1 hypothetical protein CWI41_100210 [Ordospora colligata]TBU17998.1 hypothetical protein CWI42_100200 [Ordospora colligata]